uniref:CUB domain-containing protein n=1 Tax=Megaselia scalaris TaxID=36166 RepID=T1GLF2_MEGSC
MSKTTLILVALACVGYANAGIFGGSKIECGSSTDKKSFTLINPSIPPNSCNYKVEAYSSYVCQLRIEFDMQLAQPTLPSAQNGLEYPECVDDYLEVGGYKFCGRELTAHRAGGSQLPTIVWDIRVEQLECPKGSPVRAFPIAQRASFTDGWWIAPVGCLQYFPDSTGTVTSFNYDNGLGTYQGNFDYAICFKRETSTEGIELDFDSFELGYRSDINEELGEACRPAQRNSGFNEDRLSIPDAEVEEDNINGNLFCGSSLSGKTVTSRAPGPLVLRFHSDKIYRADIPERGFTFSYNTL